MLVDRKFYLRPSPVNLPIIIFLTASIVSWIVGYGIWDVRIQVDKNLFIVQAGQFAIFALSFSAMLLAYQQNLKEKDLKIWNWLVIAIGIGGMLVEILTHQYFTRDKLGITGTLFVFPVVLTASQLFFNPDQKIGMKAICILILAVWGYWLLNNLGWKGGWVATLLGLALLSFFRSWKLFLVSLVFLALAVLVNVENLTQTLIAPEIASVSTIRPIVWMDILRMVLPRSPLLGLGLVNYMYYWFDPTFVSQARIAAGEAFINNYVFVIPSHNMFVDIFAQTGILGLGFFLWLIAAILKVLYRNSQQLRPGFERAFTIGVFAGFVAMLFNSFISADYLLPFVYNITITGFRQSVYAWILVGGAMAISTSQMNNSKSTKS
jgi:hypothetical protein